MGSKRNKKRKKKIAVGKIIPKEFEEEKKIMIIINAEGLTLLPKEKKLKKKIKINLKEKK